MTTNKKALTLIELMIAISLLAVIMLAATSFDMAIRRSFRHTDIQTQLLTQLSPAIQHMTKFIMQGIGTIVNPGIFSDNPNRMRIRLDINNATGVPNNTPWDFTDDTWVSYRFDLAPFEIHYCSNQGNNWNPCPVGADEVIARNISRVNFTLPTPGLAAIDITACFDPDGVPIACGATGNPSVNLSTQVSMRAQSVN